MRKMVEKNLIKKVVHEWIMEEGMFIKEVPEPEADFHYEMHLPQKEEIILSAIQPKGTDQLIVTAGLRLDPESIKILAQMSPEEEDEFLNNMSYLLHSRPTLFYMEEKNDVLYEVSVSELIYSDGLTKDRFMTAVKDVYKSQALAFLQIEDAVGVEALERGVETPNIVEETRTPVCSTCGNPSTYVPKYNRHYCYTCRKYLEP